MTQSNQYDSLAQQNMLDENERLGHENQKSELHISQIERLVAKNNKQMELERIGKKGLDGVLDDIGIRQETQNSVDLGFGRSKIVDGYCKPPQLQVQEPPLTQRHLTTENNPPLTERLRTENNQQNLTVVQNVPRNDVPWYRKLLCCYTDTRSNNDITL